MLKLTWIVIADLSPNRGTVVSVHTGDGAGRAAEAMRAALPGNRDVLYRPAAEPSPAIGSRIVRDSWSGPRNYEAQPWAPVGATVAPLEIYDFERAPCDEHEEYERDCPDCPMERKHVRRVARIIWTRGGVDVRAYLMLGPGWGKTEAAHAFAQRREATAKILGDEERAALE